MKITLAELNESYAALVRLSESKIPKDQFSLNWKISRFYAQAKTGIEEMQEKLVGLMKECGFVPGQEVKPQVLEEYNRLSKKFLHESDFEFSWGDPIPIQTIIDHVQVKDAAGTYGQITPRDMADLEWLFIGWE